jgi:ferritin
MIDHKVCAALNAQINAEIYSAYLYLAMSSWFDARNLKGLAGWMNVQIQEELFHAQKQHQYVLERGGKPEFGRVEAPPAQWDTPLAVFECAYEHEQSVTRAINDLVELGASAKDHATVNFLQWFVGEQVEEEASFDAIVQQLRLAGDNGAALLMLDREMAARAFVPAVGSDGKTA